MENWVLEKLLGGFLPLGLTKQGPLQQEENEDVRVLGGFSEASLSLGATGYYLHSVFLNSDNGFSSSYQFKHCEMNGWRRARPHVPSINSQLSYK